MKTLRTAAVLFLMYGIALVANAALYSSWSGDTSEIPRLIVRLVGVGAVAMGLWTHRRWAWWIGLLVGAAFAVFGVLGLWAGHTSGLFAARPYPVADYAFFAVSTTVLVGAVVMLLVPSSRALVRRAS